MLKIEEVNEKNKQRIIEFLKSDIIKHVFALYDIQHDPEHTRMYAAFENGNLKGYILTYNATEFPSVVLECEKDAAEKLIEYAPKNQFIMHASLNLLPPIKRKFPKAKHYVGNWMLVKKGEASFFKSELIRKLHSEDAQKLAMLVLGREGRSKKTVNRYINWISKMPLYGIFINNELISCASSFLQLPQIWIIGNVYTQPNHRNKGYATLALSAITEEALKHAETAALFVISDNYPAIKIYEKIGYKKIGEKLWVDVGTGRKP